MWIANDRVWSLITHEAGNGIRSWIVRTFASSASIHHLIMLIWDIKHGTVNNLLGDDYGGDSDYSAHCSPQLELHLTCWGGHGDLGGRGREEDRRTEDESRADGTGVDVIFMQYLNLRCRSVTGDQNWTAPSSSHLPVIRLFMNTCKLVSGSSHRRMRRILDSRLATNCTYLAAKHTTILSAKTQYRTFYLNTFFAVLSR